MAEQKFPKRPVQRDSSKKKIAITPTYRAHRDKSGELIVAAKHLFPHLEWDEECVKEQRKPNKKVRQTQPASKPFQFKVERFLYEAGRKFHQPAYSRRLTARELKVLVEKALEIVSSSAWEGFEPVSEGIEYTKTGMLRALSIIDSRASSGKLYIKEEGDYLKLAYGPMGRKLNFPIKVDEIDLAEIDMSTFTTAYTGTRGL